MPLLSVLWTVALLTIIASATLGSGRISYRQARNAAETARQEALAEAATGRAVLALLDRRPERRWPIDGRPQSFSFAKTEMMVSVQDELGRVDLNQADVPLLTAALRASGLSFQAATELADKIVDWRDSGDLRRLHGAKAADYLQAGRPYQPRNGPFQSVEELKLVLTMTPKIFGRLEPFVTVQSGRPMIDPQFAPPALTAALYGGNQTGNATAARTSPMPPNFPLEGRAFSIRTTFGKTAITREAIIRLTADPSRAHWLLNWRTIRTESAGGGVQQAQD